MNTATSATWIWYPGDFEVWLHRQVTLRREERATLHPPMWRLDTCFSCVTFRRQVELAVAETVHLYAQGRWTAVLDGRILHECSEQLSIPAGAHTLAITVAHASLVPALFVDGATLCSNEAWEVSANGRDWLAAGSGPFLCASEPPVGVPFTRQQIVPVHTERSEDALDGDFGRERFATVELIGVTGQGRLSVFYGESPEEAQSADHCETLDRLTVDAPVPTSIRTPTARAFRYLRVAGDANVQVQQLAAHAEEFPLRQRGAFHSSSERLNAIWQTAQETLQLNTREFFFDGIKRDRWVWSGDAYQCFLMNYYSFFDTPVTRRTLVALRGKHPIETHINQILDYSFYWFLGLYDYYHYTGDIAFIRQQWPNMVSLMAFCVGRANERGLVEGLPGDWVFLDWADLDNRGEVSAEQLLFCRSLESMGVFADLIEPARASAYRQQAAQVRQRTLAIFWDEAQGGLVHHSIGGQPQTKLTKYPNMFALLFGYLSPQQRARVERDVLCNPAVQAITTPYMRFYELAALCELGYTNLVRGEIETYWGGMLDLGATTFWEAYNPQQHGAEHYAMYGRPFGKSLCHAWGASPLYLLGRYFLGVQPSAPGYAQYTVEPQLGGLEWLQGTVPTPAGEIELHIDQQTITVRTAAAGRGVLRFHSVAQPRVDRGVVQALGAGRYEVSLDHTATIYRVDYSV